MTTAAPHAWDRRIEIDSDQPGAMVQPLSMTLDYALGQCRAHTIKRTRTNSIFKARQRRLRSHIEPCNRIAVEQHLVHRIGSQSNRVIGIRITSFFFQAEDGIRDRSPSRGVLRKELTE